MKFQRDWDTHRQNFIDSTGQKKKSSEIVIQQETLIPAFARASFLE